MKIDAEILLYNLYVKYNRLENIINSAFPNSNSDKINIYIDLYSMLQPLYRNDVHIKDYTVISASIINICAHYREFFKTRYQSECTIYLVYSNNCSAFNNQFYKNYNYSFKSLYESNKIITDLINQNIKLLKILCPYLRDVHFIETEFEVGVPIYNLLTSNPDPNMIITKDKYLYQLATFWNAIVVRPKKVNKEDKSYYINNKTLMESYLVEKKIKYRPSIKINASLFTAILALAGLRERNIKSIYNISKSTKLIEKGIINYQIPNMYINDLDSLVQSITTNTLDLNFNSENYKFRFKALDLAYMYYIYIRSLEFKQLSLKNLYDPETVRKISNRYFVTYPLHLNEL